LVFSLCGLPAAYGAEAGEGVEGAASEGEAQAAPSPAGDVLPLDTAVAVQASEADFAYTIKDSGAEYGAGVYVTRYTGTSKALAIPATLGGQPVVSVALSSRQSRQLTSLDVTQCAELKYLGCWTPGLTELNASGCVKLEWLFCGHDGLDGLYSLTELDVSGCAALTFLNCSINELATLDVSSCVALQYLDCSGNRLTTLNLGNITQLVTLYCNHNFFAELDVGSCAALKNLNCSYNLLTALDVDSNPSLTPGFWVNDDDPVGLFCHNNRIQDSAARQALVVRFESGSVLPQASPEGLLYDIRSDGARNAAYGAGAYITSYRGASKLVSVPATLGGQPVVSVDLTYGGTRAEGLTTFDVSGLASLVKLDVRGCLALTTLDASGCASLADLRYDDALTSLDLSGCSSLTSLDVRRCSSLATLDASGCSSLAVLDARGCADLSSLDVAGCTALAELYLGGNLLTSLDVTGCPALEHLACSNNPLSGLDVSRNPRLVALYCSYNGLASLDLSKNTRLRYLLCSDNLLTSLDTSRNPALEELHCYGNRLTSLDVAGSPKLVRLNCAGNSLASLDIRKNAALSWLSCANNLLSALDVTRNAALSWLDCRHNRIPDTAARRALVARFGEASVLPQDAPAAFTVSFDSRGGTAAAARTVEAGSAVGALPTPRRTGHTLLGWYTAPTGGARVAASAAVTADVTYYAQWRANTYTVKYDANGGRVAGKAAASVKRAYGSKLGTLAKPTRSGYDFLGWYTGKAKGTKVGATTKVAKSVTYYAHWKAKGPVVTLNANGGKVGGAATASVVKAKGKAVGRLATPTRTGYSFLGWFTGKVKGTKVTAKTKATRNVTLYAHWKARTYTVKFAASGGKVAGKASASVKRAYNSKLGKLSVPKRTGYQFQGWYTGKVAGKRVGSATKVTRAVTLYAHWKRVR
jgi:uncharacterized repeat protein (TIGR02543 family)